MIVRDPKGVLKIICKGADSILFALLAAKNEMNTELKEITDNYLQDYAKEGLRTLLIVERVLSHQEYDEWNARYQEACFAISGREEKLDALSTEIERDFVLVGSTAIEDKLQDDVGGTIQSLKDAGIKVWVLTGDKVETAINIAYSCKLISNEMLQLAITGSTSREVYQQL